eukprot:762452-Hanusia_phi.AAC.1
MDQFVGGTADEHKRTQQSRVQTDSGNVVAYYWNGAYRCLPEDFQWKPIGADQAFELWMHGSAKHGYPPLKEVSRRDFSSGSMSDLK